GLLVRRDVRADEPYLAVADVRIGALDRRLALSQRLHLRAGQHEPGLEALEQVILVPGPPVGRDQLAVRHSGGQLTSGPSRGAGRRGSGWERGRSGMRLW